MIEVSRQGSVTIIKLNRGIINAINPGLVNALADGIEEVRNDHNCRAMVLCSGSPKFFSIGFDIPELIGLNRRDFGVFYRGFNQMCLELFTLPKPVIAAVDGHATAGGCILTMCCDYRIVSAQKTWMGLNEAKLKVPVPHLARLILVSRIGADRAAGIMEKGDFYQGDDLIGAGFADQMAEPGKVFPRALIVASEQASIPYDHFKRLKQKRVGTIGSDVRMQDKKSRSFFIEKWFSPEAQKMLREAMEKF